MGTALACGFETGFASALSEVLTLSGTASVQASVTRGAWSAYALRANPVGAGTGYVTLNGRTTAGAGVNISKASLYVRLYFRADTLPASGDEPFLVAFAGATAKLTLRVNSSGHVAAYDSTPTLIAAGTAAIRTGVWYRIEAFVGTGNGAVVEWKVDGVTDVSTTANLNASNTDTFGVGKRSNANSNSVDFFYDDILVSDSGYPGAGRHTLLAPAANGTYQTWTIGAGSGQHYQIVSPVPPDTAFTTRYLTSTASSGNAETEAVGGHGSVVTPVNTVGSLLVAKRDGASSGLLDNRLRSGTTNTDGADWTVGATAAVSLLYYDTDPATSLAWTTGGIDGAEAGAVEKSANKSRLAGASLLVDYVLADAPKNSVAPAVTGTPAVGSTLTSDTGTWTNTPTSYAYRWRWGDTQAVIAGATASTYVPVAGDAGHTLQAGVTASNAGGAGTEAWSSATAMVTTPPSGSSPGIGFGFGVGFSRSWMGSGGGSSSSPTTFVESLDYSDARNSMYVGMGF